MIVQYSYGLRALFNKEVIFAFFFILITLSLGPLMKYKAGG